MTRVFFLCVCRLFDVVNAFDVLDARKKREDVKPAVTSSLSTLFGERGQMLLFLLLC